MARRRDKSPAFVERPALDRTGEPLTAPEDTLTTSPETAAPAPVEPAPEADAGATGPTESPAAEAAVKSLERRLDPQATGQTTYQRTDDQGDHHMHAGQAEDQHDADRGNDCIHFVTS